MKRGATIAVILLACGVALAQDKTVQKPAEPDTCQKYEYAELKDQTKERLLWYRCSYEKLSHIAEDSFNNQLKINQKLDAACKTARDAGLACNDEVGERGREALTQYRIQAAQCSTEASRAGDVLNKVYKVKEVECDAYFAKLKKEKEAKK